MMNWRWWRPSRGRCKPNRRRRRPPAPTCGCCNESPVMNRAGNGKCSSSSRASARTGSSSPSPRCGRPRACSRRPGSSARRRAAFQQARQERQADHRLHRSSALRRRAGPHGRLNLLPTGDWLRQALVASTRLARSVSGLSIDAPGSARRMTIQQGGKKLDVVGMPTNTISRPRSTWCGIPA